MILPYLKELFKHISAQTSMAFNALLVIIRNIWVQSIVLTEYDLILLLDISLSSDLIGSTDAYVCALNDCNLTTSFAIQLNYIISLNNTCPY